jgi:hypothetical protein
VQNTFIFAVKVCWDSDTLACAEGDFGARCEPSAIRRGRAQDRAVLARAHVGQSGTYVAIVDDKFGRAEIHAPTIGSLLCTGKTGPTVRYALAGTRLPIVLADYQRLPEEARGVLPSAAGLEAVIENELNYRG